MTYLPVLLIMAGWVSAHRVVVTERFPTEAACERGAEEIRKLAFPYSGTPVWKCLKDGD